MIYNLYNGKRKSFIILKWINIVFAKIYNDNTKQS